MMGDGMKSLLTVVGTMAAGLWLAVPALAQLLCVLMLTDVATGLLLAWGNKALSSSASLEGMRKKGMTLLMVFMAGVLETYAGAAPAGSVVSAVAGLPLVNLVAGFYCTTELLSIAENAAKGGAPLPPFLRDALVKAPANKPTSEQGV